MDAKGGEGVQNADGLVVVPGQHLGQPVEAWGDSSVPAPRSSTPMPRIQFIIILRLISPSATCTLRPFL